MAVKTDNAARRKRDAVRRAREAERQSKEDGLVILEELARLDDVLSAKHGPEWIDAEEADMDGPLMYYDGKTARLGPRGIALMLHLRRIGGMDALTTYRMFDDA